MIQDTFLGSLRCYVTQWGGGGGGGEGVSNFQKKTLGLGQWEGVCFNVIDITVTRRVRLKLRVSV